MTSNAKLKETEISNVKLPALNMVTTVLAMNFQMTQSQDYARPLQDIDASSFVGIRHS